MIFNSNFQILKLEREDNTNAQNRVQDTKQFSFTNEIQNKKKSKKDDQLIIQTIEEKILR